MQALQVLSEVQRRGVELWPAGEYLEFSPASALTPELVEGLRENKLFILEHLKRREERRQDTSPRVANVGEVFEIAREVLPELKEEDRVDLDELIQANSPPAPGRDPLAKHETAKAHFFHAPADCTCDVCLPEPKYARRRDGKTFEGGRA